MAAEPVSRWSTDEAALVLAPLLEHIDASILPFVIGCIELHAQHAARMRLGSSKCASGGPVCLAEVRFESKRHSCGRSVQGAIDLSLA